jgi:hypothetical protein
MNDNLAHLDLQYHQITELYALAEELVATAEHPSVVNPDAQLDLIEPLVNQIGESTDVLCEEFIEIAGKQQKNTARRGRVEGALRKIYSALDTYQQQVATASNVANAIVEKIKRQVESVIVLFVEYVELTLDRIMHKQQIEELKKRQEKIAQMLYVAERNRTRDVGA